MVHYVTELHIPGQKAGGTVPNIPLLVKEKDPKGSCLPYSQTLTPSYGQSVPPPASGT